MQREGERTGNAPIGDALMRHDFSAQYLRITPPDTTFGQAWESLCHALLCAELRDPTLLRLAPPDVGIDILDRNRHHAYQCKSNGCGAFGTLSAAPSVASLTSAVAHQRCLDWQQYSFCTNAHYTGHALGKISDEAASVGVPPENLHFRGPEYWDNLCTRYADTVAERFDYRVTATENQVVDALRSAGYYDGYVSEFEEQIRRAGFRLVIVNNRTPLELSIPFSPELTVENCLDVAKQMLGISLDWTNFADIGTSAGPSLSLTIDRSAQSFSTKIADLPLGPVAKLQLWIKIIWRDETAEDGVDESSHVSYCLMARPALARPEREPLDQSQRRETTIERAEQIIQSAIWDAARNLGSA